MVLRCTIRANLQSYSWTAYCNSNLGIIDTLLPFGGRYNHSPPNTEYLAQEI